MMVKSNTRKIHSTSSVRFTRVFRFNNVNRVGNERNASILILELVDCSEGRGLRRIHSYSHSLVNKFRKIFINMSLIFK